MQQLTATTRVLHSTTSGTDYRNLTIDMPKSIGISGKGFDWFKQYRIEQIRHLFQRWILLIIIMDSFFFSFLCIICITWSFLSQSTFYASSYRLNSITNRRLSKRLFSQNQWLHFRQVRICNVRTSGMGQFVKGTMVVWLNRTFQAIAQTHPFSIFTYRSSLLSTHWDIATPYGVIYLRQ